VNPAGQAKVLYSFTGGADGSNPLGGVVGDSAGNLYGTTYYGGLYPGTAGMGVVYKLDPTGHLTVLHTFSGIGDGAGPAAGLVRDPAANLYGTTYAGGQGSGTVFEIDAAGNESVLYQFGSLDAQNPLAGLTLDSSGNLYGTTFAGGANGAGTVFELAASGQESVLYSFGAGPNGHTPLTV
jgi:uncharacterized repeat protein (TIGR03803 family)